MAPPIQRITQAPTSQIAEMQNVSVGLTNLQGFELAQRAAKLLSSSTLVPKEYQNNLPNCVVALNMAQRLGADALMVMQNLVIVHSRPTWASQFLIATFNSCGRFSPIRYEFIGKEGTDEWGCRATATELASGEKLSGPLVTIAIAKKEGWYGRSGSKWQTMPEQMLRYRSASWFVRTTAPELSMGLQTAEEIHDVYDATPTNDGTFEVVNGATLDADIVDPNTGEIVEQDEIANKKAEIAAQIEANRAVDTSTGEILDERTAQAVSVDEEQFDPYTDFRLALEDCQTISDVTRLFQSLDATAKKDETIRALVTERQEIIKAEKGMA